MHYGTLKMSKAPPFTESSCWAIFLLKSLPMCINMWVKVKEMMLITALCVYGPLSKLVDLAQFGSFWSLFLHFFGPIRVWMAQNQVQWDRVLLYCSGGGLWGPFWDILECFLSPEEEARACLEPFSHLIGYPKWLEWPIIWYSGGG